MTRILHWSDPHFGTEHPSVAEALLRFAHACAPTAIVLSGDVTQRARPAQFAAARAFCDRLPAVPQLVIPGNHDIPLYNVAARLLAPYRGYRKAFGDDLEPLIDLPDALLIGVNTTRAARHKEGMVSSEQVARVADRLRAARPGQLRVVVTHQPMQVTKEIDIENLLNGHAAAATAWSAAGCDILLGGHIHLAYVRSLRERHANLPREVWVVQAGTAVSHRTRGARANSVNLLRHGADAAEGTCTVEQWDCAPGGEFVLAHSKQVALDPDAAVP